MGVVCAFNRNRDWYEVPLAFAEAGELDCFVTDYYSGRPLQHLRSLRDRQAKGIEPALVRTAASAFAIQAVWLTARRLNRNVKFPSAAVDGAIGRRTRQVTRRSVNSSLLIHAGYALEAFEASPNVSKTLFEYHPAPRLVNLALAEDEVGDSMAFDVTEPEEDNTFRLQRSEAERRHATGFIVASTFTARGLKAAGVPADRIRVVPYGVSVIASTANDDGNGGDVSFLFVGQGLRRKGLHILLLAWEQARIREAHLTLVCYRIDPKLKKLAERLPGVRLLSKQSEAELAALFQSHDVFVLPSLVEGFGLVLLEALASGCRLIGTDHTGLPDLRLPLELSTVVRSGDVGSLADALQASVRSRSESLMLRRVAKEAAREWSWSRYRESIRTAHAELSRFGATSWHADEL